MKKIYHNLVVRRADIDHKDKRVYLSTRQGSAPTGWVCIAVCGYHEK